MIGLLRLYALMLVLLGTRYLLYFGVMLIIGAAFVYGVIGPRRLDAKYGPLPEKDAALQPTTRSINSNEPSIARVIEFAIGGIDWEEHRQELARKDAAREREARVRSAHRHTVAQVAALETWRGEFSRKVRDSLNAAVTQRTLPDDLLLLLATEGSAAEAWGVIKSPAVSMDAISTLRGELDVVEHRIFLGTFSEEDYRQLGLLETKAREMLLLLPEQQSALDHIIVLNQARDFMREQASRKGE